MFGGIDDIFGQMDRMMNNMNQMMGGMMGGGLMGPSPFGLMNNQMQLMQNPHRMGNQMSMFGGPSNMSMMSFSSMPGQSVSYSSKVMTISNDGSGRPQVYEQTSSQVCGPNGIRETKETVRDSRTGVQQIKVGRHINDRGHLKQKKRNVYNGDEEEEEELVNLDEDELDEFNNDYIAKSRDFRQKYQSIGGGQPTGRQRLALTNGPSSSQTASYPTQAHPQQAPSYSQQVPSYPPQATSSRQQYYQHLAQEQDTRPPSRGKSKVKFEPTADKKSKKLSKSKKPY